MGLLAHFLLHRAGTSADQRLAAALATIIALVIGYPIGLLIGHFISRDSDVDTIGFRAIAWLSLVGWLMPVVGFALSAMVWLFSRRSQEHRSLYWWLSLICGLLAMANAAAGPLLQSNGAFFRSTIRSTERCPYAARENWSMSDVHAYCFPPTAQPGGRAPQ
ncbi:MAG: hypothetical protein ABIS51_01360 [Sphingomonas sp.]